VEKNYRSVAKDKGKACLTEECVCTKLSSNFAHRNKLVFQHHEEIQHLAVCLLSSRQKTSTKTESQFNFFHDILLRWCAPAKIIALATVMFKNTVTPFFSSFTVRNL